MFTQESWRHFAPASNWVNDATSFSVCLGGILYPIIHQEGQEWGPFLLGRCMEGGPICTRTSPDGVSPAPVWKAIGHAFSCSKPNKHESFLHSHIKFGINFYRSDGGGYPTSGTPPPGHVPSQVINDTPRSVCLLRSRRRTFLFKK